MKKLEVCDLFYDWNAAWRNWSKYEAMRTDEESNPWPLEYDISVVIPVHPRR
jgi:hypothetical protein